MQTPGERDLIQVATKYLQSCTAPAEGFRLLNLGASTSTVIEDYLEAFPFVADRADVEPCAVDHPRAGAVYANCGAERLPMPDNTYDLIFANYVLEHVPGIADAAREITRVLKPGGLFVASVPNPQAPEFRVARHTPTWFHRLIKGKHVWEIAYAFKTPRDLEPLFALHQATLAHYSATSSVESYLYRFPLLHRMSVSYDNWVNARGKTSLQGHVCIAFRKSAVA